MNKLQNIFQELPIEQVELQLGSAQGEALTNAFKQKRVVHAKGYGKTLSPLELQDTWKEIVNNKSLVQKQRTAYIHIPFCKTKCLYCGFFQNYSNKNLEDVYVDKLVKEINAAKNEVYLQAGSVNAVFFGGGTPSALSANNIQQLVQKGDVDRENLLLKINSMFVKSS